MFYSFVKRELKFKRTARTSRGSLNTHQAYYLTISDGKKSVVGEASPLPGLSVDYTENFETHLSEVCSALNAGIPVKNIDLTTLPSVRFALDTAMKSMELKLPFQVFNTGFYSGKSIPINGLIWMNKSEEMLKEAFEKIEDGFKCLKFKIGALDFDEECRMLEEIRKSFSAFSIQIRLDANGAFAAADAIEKLTELSRFGIHSIEQPIKAGQAEWLGEVCAKSPIPVALDEELIGVSPFTKGSDLLNLIKPAYIILKPTLIGDFSECNQWVEMASRKDIGWWATSALESSIGLNSIAQWCSGYNPSIPQGLGTGSLYLNNILSPLSIHSGSLYYNSELSWHWPNEEVSPES